MGIQWWPAHRGPEDKAAFARIKPSVMLIGTVDLTVPYLEDLPDSVELLVVRNHPISELYDQRDLRDFGQATRSLNASEKYEQYFKQHFAGNFKRQALLPVSVTRGVNDREVRYANAIRIGERQADDLHQLVEYCAKRGWPREKVCVLGINEPHFWEPNEAPDLVGALEVARLRRSHMYGDWGAYVGAGVGWPGNGGVQDAPPIWDWANQLVSLLGPYDYLHSHEYHWYTWDWLWPWYNGRCLQRTAPQVRWLITECGRDGGVVQHANEGWLSGGFPGCLEGTLDEKARLYVDELINYSKKLMAARKVRAILPFTYDIPSSHWQFMNLRYSQFVDTLVPRLGELEFTWNYANGHTEPQPDPDPPQDELQQWLRNAAWNESGIALNPDAAFYKKAAELKLGRPVTNEFRRASGDKMYVLQGFDAGILYCKEGEWDKISSLGWLP